MDERAQKIRTLKDKLKTLKDKKSRTQKRIEHLKKAQGNLSEANTPAGKLAKKLSNTEEDLGKGAKGLSRLDSIRTEIANDASDLFGFRNTADYDDLNSEIYRLDRELTKYDSDISDTQYQINQL